MALGRRFETSDDGQLTRTAQLAERVSRDGVASRIPTPPPTAASLPQRIATETVSMIGGDLSIEGQAIVVRCKSELRINGAIQGEVHGRTVLVGLEAQVQGAIMGDHVEVNGRVQGTIRCKRLILRANAVVDGDVMVQSLQVEEGASIEGRLMRVQDMEMITPQVESRIVLPSHRHGVAEFN